MSRCRVVQPEMVRLPMSEGDFVDVQRELNAGDYYDMIAEMAERKPFAKIARYVIGWSLVGLDDKPIPWPDGIDARRDTIRSLDTRTMRELVDVIDRHEEAVDAAHEAKKKIPTGIPVSVGT